jgi:hypothetical protein
LLRLRPWKAGLPYSPPSASFSCFVGSSGEAERDLKFRHSQRTATRANKQSVASIERQSFCELCWSSPSKKSYTYKARCQEYGCQKPSERGARNAFSNLAISAFLRPLRVQRNSPLDFVGFHFNVSLVQVVQQEHSGPSCAEHQKRIKAHSEESAFGTYNQARQVNGRYGDTEQNCDE